MKTKDTKRKWIERDGLITHKIGTVTVDEMSIVNRVITAEMIAGWINRSYSLGRQDEFEDNLKRAEKLLEEYGI